MRLRFARVETGAEEAAIRSLMQESGKIEAWIALKKSVPLYTNVRYFSQVSTIAQFLRWEDGSAVVNLSLTMNDLGLYRQEIRCISADVSSGQAKFVDELCSSRLEVLCMKGKRGRFTFS